MAGGALECQCSQVHTMLFVNIVNPYHLSKAIPWILCVLSYTRLTSAVSAASSAWDVSAPDTRLCPSVSLGPSLHPATQINRWFKWIIYFIRFSSKIILKNHPLSHSLRSFFYRNSVTFSTTWAIILKHSERAMQCRERICKVSLWGYT